jgi:hypothetical protein
MIRRQLTFRGIISVSTTTQAGVTVKTTEGLPFLKSVGSGTFSFGCASPYALNPSFVRVILSPSAGIFQLSASLLLILPILLLLLFQYLVLIFVIVSLFYGPVVVFILLSPLLSILIKSLFILLSISFVFVANILKVGVSVVRLALSATRVQPIRGLTILKESTPVFPFLALSTLLKVIHFTYQMKERPWLKLPVLSRTKQRQRRSDLMIAKYDFSGNYLVRDTYIIAQMG